MQRATSASSVRTIRWHWMQRSWRSMDVEMKFPLWWECSTDVNCFGIGRKIQDKFYHTEMSHLDKWPLILHKVIYSCGTSFCGEHSASISEAPGQFILEWSFSHFRWLRRTLWNWKILVVIGCTQNQRYSIFILDVGTKIDRTQVSSD